MDGLPTHESCPGVVVLPGTTRRAHRRDPLPAPRRGAVRRARRRHRALRRRARRAATPCSSPSPGSTASSSVDPVRRRAVVEPGVVNARLSEAALPHGLHYVPDPSSQTRVHHRRQRGRERRRAALPQVRRHHQSRRRRSRSSCPTATLARLGSRARRAVGTRPRRPLRRQRGDVRHRLPKSPSGSSRCRRRSAPCSPTSPRIRAASEAVSAIIAAGIVPAALEMMDQACVQAVEASIYAAGYPTDAAAVLLVELDGAARGRRGRARAGRGAAPASTARARSGPPTTAAERARLWQGRKKAFGAMGRIAPDLAVQDAVVPRSRAARHPRPDRRDRRDTTGSTSATSSTPATATCTRTSASIGATRTWRARVQRGEPRDHGRLRRGRRAASPASTAWAPTSSTTCRSSSTPRRSAPCRPCGGSSIPAERANPGKVSRSTPAGSGAAAAGTRA